jgi:hypothetical protein
MAGIVPDDSFSYTQQFLKTRAVHIEQCDVWNVRGKSAFDFDLNTWKQNSLFNQHTPLPPERLVKPEPYKIFSLDEEKFKQRFQEYWNTKEFPAVMTYDFYIVQVAELPASTWDLTPANQGPAVNTLNPIGAEDPGMGAPGWYLNVGGDSFKEGDMFRNGSNVYWLVRLRDNPFAPGKKITRWALEGVARPETLNH